MKSMNYGSRHFLETAHFPEAKSSHNYEKKGKRKTVQVLLIKTSFLYIYCLDIGCLIELKIAARHNPH